MSLIKRPQQLPSTIEECHVLINKLFDAIEHVEELQQRIEELEEQLQQHSENTSHPPSKNKLHERGKRRSKLKSPRTKRASGTPS